MNSNLLPNYNPFPMVATNSYPAASGYSLITANVHNIEIMPPTSPMNIINHLLSRHCMEDHLHVDLIELRDRLNQVIAAQMQDKFR